MARNLDHVGQHLVAAFAGLSPEPLVELPARKALLDEFRALADQVDGLWASSVRGGGLSLSFGRRWLVLLPHGSADLSVHYEGVDDELLTRDPTGRWIWRSHAGRAVFDDDALEGLFSAAFGLATREEVAAAVPHEHAPAKGPRDGEMGHMGRSGTRGFKRAQDVSPGSAVRDIKSPFDS